MSNLETMDFDDIHSGHWFKWQWRCNRGDLESLEERATERLRDATLELAAAEEVLSAIRVRKIWRILRSKNIHRDSKVIVCYAEGEQRATLVGVEKDLTNQICVRHFTTKGKPAKLVSRMNASMAKHIRIADQ